ncbi:MAG: endolytic transglycosylase MltG, partial [Acetobacterium sp.]|nr:endolytic transglycosylase MltG [Acetobacterium sp.]
LKQTKEMDKTVDEIVIMASIVELETKFVEDKANAASVFYNRIAENMPLQSDITVDYARGEKTPVLTTEQTKFASPYNTYINTGLPFGPICSFGETSLEAALNPAKTSYLYFVADMDSGKIYFNETYDEHLEDVQRYMGD